MLENGITDDCQQAESIVELETVAFAETDCATCSWMSPLQCVGFREELAFTWRQA